MAETRFHFLLQQFLAGKGDVTAWRELEEMVHSGHHEEEIRALYDEVYHGPEQAGDMSSAGIRAVLLEVQAATPVRTVTYRRWWVAAAILLLLATTTVLWLYKRPAPQLAVASHIHPATDKAMLTLSDGSTVTLDAAGGTIAEQDGVQVVNLSGGRLQYKGGSAPVTGKLAYNTLTVPRGGMFMIMLPDGTHVWLNSATALKYPTIFAADSREVELDGEAYFEVAASRTPFKVKTRSMQVEVLGTAFDIMAYKEEGTVATTLVQGKVAVNNTAGRMVLQPDEQATLPDGSTAFINSKPDMNEVLAWKNGTFKFNQRSLSSILRQVARWYDVDIVYQGAVPDVSFDGDISRKSNVADLLEVLQATHAVHFVIQDRTILVMPGSK